MASPNPVTFTDRMRKVFKRVLDPIAGTLARFGFSPNTVTIIGCVGNAIGGLILAAGWIPLGGLIILISAPIDALDGALARLQNKKTRFGAFLDSVTDRWSELFLYGGLTFYYASQSSVLGVLLAFAAMAGSIMVSYTKARAEGLGFTCNIGLLSRLERYLVICPALLLNIPLIGLLVVATLSIFTAWQRVWYVHSQPENS